MALKIPQDAYFQYHVIFLSKETFVQLLLSCQAVKHTLNA